MLGINIPIVAAPMAGASGGLLAAQVTAGGGFGFLAAGYRSADSLTSELSLARGLLHLNPSDPLPIGVGYLAWQLEKPTANPEALLSAALDNHVQAIWLAFGNDIKEWIKFIRNYDAQHKRPRPTTIFVPVSSVEEALVASDEWKVDVLVAQGNESGGHGYGSAPPLFTLVSSILAALPTGGPPVLAAGGLMTGSQVASFLVLGAAGAVLGTRFLMTPENWPTGVDGRGLYNNTVKDMDNGVDVETVKMKFEAGVRDGDPGRMLVWSGMGVGLVSEIKSAEEVIHELGDAILQRLKVASELAR
ncbi:2-nitropropane dioxygenase [Boletus edulis BED1]|uniref:2-nitropropane dioxygenase n=1 Tax=Boletus edulis BED1 TaxID=1328754 RepID=A0AAD4C6H4_BOLED|nr:2-nitropropane dioxygenase [Boletus edulis BED1]